MPAVPEVTGQRWRTVGWVLRGFAAVLALLIGFFAYELRSCGNADIGLKIVPFCKGWPADGIAENQPAPTPKSDTAFTLFAFKYSFYERPTSALVARDLDKVTDAVGEYESVNPLLWAAAQPNLHRVNAYAAAHCR